MIKMRTIAPTPMYMAQSYPCGAWSNTFAYRSAPMARVVIMGVAGAGKTTVGNLASELLGFPFLDADDLHSPADRASMAIGEPLDDHRRDVWIERVRTALGQHSDVVMACSALRRRHRQRLRIAGAVMFFLDVPAEELARRLDERQAHFFPPTLLASQFAALDPVEPDEGVTVLDGAQPAAVLADAIDMAVRRSRIAHSDP